MKMVFLAMRALVCALLGGLTACLSAGGWTDSWSPGALLLFAGGILVGSTKCYWMLWSFIGRALKRYSAWCTASYKEPQP